MEVLVTTINSKFYLPYVVMLRIPIPLSFSQIYVYLITSAVIPAPVSAIISKSGPTLENFYEISNANTESSV